MKNKMKKGLLVLLVISFLVLPTVGLAEIRPAPRIGLLGPGGAIEIITNILFTILMAIAAIFIILGAFEFLTAGGEAEKINQARQRILYALIAVVVALLARGIVDFIRGAFPGA